MIALTDIHSGSALNLPVVTVRRSVLCVPAGNQRALDKVAGLDCDAVIFDLEDSVSIEMKGAARDNLRRLFSQSVPSDVGTPDTIRRERIVRINSPSVGGERSLGHADMALVLEIAPDVVLVPKVEHVDDIQIVADILSEAGAPDTISIWAMIETPKGVINATSIAAADRRVKALVVGLNDLRKATGVLPQPGRTYLVPFLMQVVLAARAHGIDVIDSVFNDFRDAGGFEAECGQGRAMGFSGKMLIHPAQIDPANRHFGPSAEAVRDAREIIAGFAKPEAKNLNVINLDGRMVERLHLEEAEKLVALADILSNRKTEA
jgi:citrate lyase subunit beta / citryl-CoA lyase